MSNEETIIMRPQDKDEAKQTINAETSAKVKKSGNGKKVAATVAAAGVGGVVGAGAFAATNALNTNEEEVLTEKPEQTTEDEAPQVEVKAEEEPQVAEVKVEEEPQVADVKVEEEPQTIEAKEVVEDIHIGEGEHLIYSNNEGGEDPIGITEEPEELDVPDYNPYDVQVLGVYDVATEGGQDMTVAPITDGNDIGYLIDVNSDGVVDALAYDANHNDQLDEGEVVDVSNYNIQMPDAQDVYYTQQNEQMQQDYDTYTCNASEEPQDYNNDIDQSMV